MKRPNPAAMLLCCNLYACAVDHDANQYLAPYDPACDSLDAEPPDVESVLAAEGVWETPIVRVIHQIWLGPVAPFDRDYADKVHAWQTYAQQLGYEHRLWHESDLDALRAQMAPGNAELFEDLLRQNIWYAYQAAADVMRYEIIHQLGGMYVDCDIHPPTYRGQFIDFARLVPMRGLVLVPEPGGRNIGSGDSVFAMNGWFMASAGHPAMGHLTRSVHRNVQRWNGEQDRLVAAYATGPFLLNRTLAGSFTMLPVSLLKKLEMFDFW